MKLAPIALALLLAGCSTALSPTPSARAVPATAFIHQCTMSVSQFPIDLAAAKAALPSELSPLVVDPAGRTAYSFIDTYQCQNATVDGRVAIQDVHEAIVGIVIDPKSTWARADADILIAVLDMPSAPALRDAYAAWGIPSSSATPSVSFTATPAARTATASIQGNYTIAYETDVPARTQTIPAGGARLVGVENRSITGALDMDWPPYEQTQPGAARMLSSQGAPLPDALGPGLAIHEYGEHYDLAIRPVVGK